MDDNINKGTVSHEGIVCKKDNNSVIVRIKSSSACSGCHAEGYCNITDNKEKLINVTGSYNVNPGDPVIILMKQSMGFRALILGYLLPLVILVASLVVFLGMQLSELTAGLLSIAILLPYFLILYLLRNRISNKFNFTIKT